MTDRDQNSVRKLVQFLRSCRAEGVPAERARESLAHLGFDRAIIAEADRRIDDADWEGLDKRISGLIDDDREEAVGVVLPPMPTGTPLTRAPLITSAALTPAEGEDARIAYLDTQLRIQVERVRSQMPPAGASGVRLSILQGGQAFTPLLLKSTSTSDDTLLGLTAQMLAEAPLLAAADRSVTGIPDSEVDTGRIPAPHLVSDVTLRRFMRAVPAALTLFLVAWAALHMPPVPSQALHVREALMAPPPALGTVAGKPGNASLQTTPLQTAEQKSGLADPSRAPAANTNANAVPPVKKGFSFSPRGLYKKLKSSLPTSLGRVASLSSRGPASDGQGATLQDTSGEGFGRSHAVWWREDPTAKEFSPAESAGAIGKTEKDQ